MRSMKLPSTVLVTAALVASSGAAFAQAAGATATGSATIPKETVKANTATKGKTDVATGGFASSAKPEDDAKSAEDLSIAAGGLFTSGNARTVAITSLVKGRIRRDEHQFSAAGAINFARAGKRGETVDTTVENYQGLLRYDFFFSDRVSVFLQSSARRDRFQGLDLRLNVDPGLAYYFINTKQQRLQAEGGYDLQHDIRRDADLIIPPPDGSPAGTLPTVVDKTKTLHNARLFLGYENKLYEQVSFVTSLEYLQAFEDLGTYRLIFDAGLKTNIAEKFAVATTYTMRFENKPLPGLEKADSIASVNLVYTLF
jgi:putative salt-induced outer membrane protein